MTAALLLALTVAARAQVSLATVVDLAQRESTAVRLAQADVNKAQAVLEQTHDVYIPNLSIGSTLGYSYGFPTGQPSIFNLSMNSLVMSYAQRQYMKAARAGLDAANLNLKEAREQVALEASTSYIEMDTINRELDLARRQQESAERLVAIEQQRAEAGVDPALDFLQARLTAANLKLARLHLETRAATLAKRLSTLTGLPVGSITPNRASIPEIPAIQADAGRQPLAGIKAAHLSARSRQMQALGDDLSWRRPQVAFGVTYNLDSDQMNNYSQFYRKGTFQANNISFGLQFNVPFFDFALRAKARQSASEALRAKVEAEQAEQQNDTQIAQLTGNLRELDTQAEVAGLKQQIAEEQLKSVVTSLELGTGADASAAGSPAQTSPKQEQLARIDAAQKQQEALDAGFQLAQARLGLLRALGHMEEWLKELNAK
jgi:outer membrane protein TolC